MSKIQALHDRKSQLTKQISDMAGKKGVSALRAELETVNARLKELAAYRLRLKANINSGNAVVRYDRESTRRVLQMLAGCEIKRGTFEELFFGRVQPYWASGFGQTCELFRAAADHPTHPNAKPFAPWVQANRTVEAGLIAEHSAEFDRKRYGEAVNVDIYGHNADGTLVLVQVRPADVGKFGTSTKKNYFVTDGSEAVEIIKGKGNIKKAAALDPAPDSPLRYVSPQLKAEWQARIDATPFKFPAPQFAVHEVFKILHDDAGTLRSVYSGEEYKLGQEKKQKVRTEHRGGYYAFPSREAAMATTEAGKTCADHIEDGKRLVLVKGRAFGTPLEYSYEKLAFSRLVIDEIVCNL